MLLDLHTNFSGGRSGQVVWYSYLFKNFPQFVVIHTVKGFGVVNKAEVEVFLEQSCFFSDPTDVSNLISASSGFSKSSLNIWKFTVHVTWSLAWRILSITLLACEMNTLVHMYSFVCFSFHSLLSEISPYCCMYQSFVLYYCTVFFIICIYHNLSILLLIELFLVWCY